MKLRNIFATKVSTLDHNYLITGKIYAQVFYNYSLEKCNTPFDSTLDQNPLMKFDKWRSMELSKKI